MANCFYNKQDDTLSFELLKDILPLLKNKDNPMSTAKVAIILLKYIGKPLHKKYFDLFYEEFKNVDPENQEQYANELKEAFLRLHINNCLTKDWETRILQYAKGNQWNKILSIVKDSIENNSQEHKEDEQK